MEIAIHIPTEIVEFAKANWWIGIIAWYLLAIWLVRKLVTKDNSGAPGIEELAAARAFIWITSPVLAPIVLVCGVMWFLFRERREQSK